MREDFCMKFYTTVSNQVHTLSASLVEISWKVTNLCYFNQDNPHFSDCRAFTGGLLVSVSVCWWWDEDADLQTDRVTADARRDHHWQPQPRRQSGTWWYRHRLVHVFSWHLFPWSAKWHSTHQLSYALAGVYDTFPLQHSAPDVTVQWVQIWRAEDHSVFSMNPFAFCQFCMTLAHWERRVVLAETA